MANIAQVCWPTEWPSPKGAVRYIALKGHQDTTFHLVQPSPSPGVCPDAIWLVGTGKRHTGSSWNLVFPDPCCMVHSNSLMSPRLLPPAYDKNLTSTLKSSVNSSQNWSQVGILITDQTLGARSKILWHYTKSMIGDRRNWWSDIRMHNLCSVPWDVERPHTLHMANKDSVSTIHRSARGSATERKSSRNGQSYRQTLTEEDMQKAGRHLRC